MFKNVRVYFLGSDDFSLESKQAATAELTADVREGALGLPVGARFALDEIAEAHEHIEGRKGPGRVVVAL